MSPRKRVDAILSRPQHKPGKKPKSRVEIIVIDHERNEKITFRTNDCGMEFIVPRPSLPARGTLCIPEREPETVKITFKVQP